jgi:hypothetical protein
MSGCNVEGCERPHAARGLCQPHYDRWRRRGDVLAGVPFGQARRSVTGPFHCTCPVSRPAGLGVCTFCGYPCVHRMCERTRKLALEKSPGLRRQIVLEGVVA